MGRYDIITGRVSEIILSEPVDAPIITLAGEPARGQFFRTANGVSIGNVLKLMSNLSDMTWFNLEVFGDFNGEVFFNKTNLDALSEDNRIEFVDMLNVARDVARLRVEQDKQHKTIDSQMTNKTLYGIITDAAKDPRHTDESEQVVNGCTLTPLENGWVRITTPDGISSQARNMTLARRTAQALL